MTGRPRLELTDAERIERQRQQSRERAARYRKRMRTGERVLTVRVPPDVADELPDADEGDAGAALIELARAMLLRDDA